MTIKAQRYAENGYREIQWIAWMKAGLQAVGLCPDVDSDHL